MVTIGEVREKIHHYKNEYTNAHTFTQVANIDYSILLFLDRMEYALEKGKFTPKEKKELYKGYVRLKKMRGDI